MSCLCLAFCNPLWLTLLVLFVSLRILLPAAANPLVAFVVASVPLIALVLTASWLERVSDIFKQVGAPFKFAVLLLAILGMLDSEAYFTMIAAAVRGFSTESLFEASALLSLVATTLVSASIITLLIVALTLIVEFSVRLVIGKQTQDLNPMLEGLRALMIMSTGILCASAILEWLNV